MKLTIPILLISLFCLNNTNLYSQNAPITIAGDYTTYETAISIPITTENFNNIGSCDLQLEYDETIVNAIAVTQAGLQGNFFNVYLGDPGKISLGWLTYPAFTLPDESIRSIPYSLLELKLLLIILLFLELLKSMPS